MDFGKMKRVELQRLCKKHKIPANLTNLAMAHRLSLLFKELQSSSLTNSPENFNENDSEIRENGPKNTNHSFEKDTDGKLVLEEGVSSQPEICLRRSKRISDKHVYEPMIHVHNANKRKSMMPKIHKVIKPKSCLKQQEIVYVELSDSEKEHSPAVLSGIGVGDSIEEGNEESGEKKLPVHVNAVADNGVIACLDDVVVEQAEEYQSTSKLFIEDKWTKADISDDVMSVKEDSVYCARVGLGSQMSREEAFSGETESGMNEKDSLVQKVADVMQVSNVVTVVIGDRMEEDAATKILLDVEAQSSGVEDNAAHGSANYLDESSGHHFSQKIFPKHGTVEATEITLAGSGAEIFDAMISVRDDSVYNDSVGVGYQESREEATVEETIKIDFEENICKSGAYLNLEGQLLKVGEQDMDVISYNYGDVKELRPHETSAGQIFRPIIFEKRDLDFPLVDHKDSMDNHQKGSKSTPKSSLKKVTDESVKFGNSVMQTTEELIKVESPLTISGAGVEDSMAEGDEELKPEESSLSVNVLASNSVFAIVTDQNLCSRTPMKICDGGEHEEYHSAPKLCLEETNAMDFEGNFCLDGAYHDVDGQQTLALQEGMEITCSRLGDVGEVRTHETVGETSIPIILEEANINREEYPSNQKLYLQQEQIEETKIMLADSGAEIFDKMISLSDFSDHNDGALHHLNGELTLVAEESIDIISPNSEGVKELGAYDIPTGLTSRFDISQAMDIDFAAAGLCDTVIDYILHCQTPVKGNDESEQAMSNDKNRKLGDEVEAQELNEATESDHACLFKFSETQNSDHDVFSPGSVEHRKENLLRNFFATPDVTSTKLSERKTSSQAAEGFTGSMSLEDILKKSITGSHGESVEVELKGREKYEINTLNSNCDKIASSCSLRISKAHFEDGNGSVKENVDIPSDDLVEGGVCIGISGKVTTEVLVDDVEFSESTNAASSGTKTRLTGQSPANDEFAADKVAGVSKKQLQQDLETKASEAISESDIPVKHHLSIISTQKTPGKLIIAADMKENVQSFKRQPDGLTAAKSTRKRRALEEL